MKSNAKGVIGCALAVGLTIAGVQAATGEAKVLSIRAGSAQYSIDGKTWQVLQVGSVLKPGAIIKTDAASIVDLNLDKNGPLVRLTPTTTLKLVTLDVAEGAGESIITTEMELSEGKIHAIVRKHAAGSKWEVKTPVAVCGVEYGRVTITAAGQLMVLDGRGYTLYAPPGEAQAKRFEVAAQYMFEPTLNANQGGVIPLLASLANELRNATAQLQMFLPVEERVLAWRPTPVWSMPGRPFSSPAGEVGSDPAWTLPPVLNPTSPVRP